MFGRVWARVGCGALAAASLIAAVPAQAVERDLVLQNDCGHPVRLLIAHAFDDDTWDVHGWYEFSANEESTQLTEDDEPLTQLDDHQVYIYGETTDGSDVFWEGEDYYGEFGEVTYGMMRAVLEVVSGDIQVRLVCEGY